MPQLMNSSGQTYGDQADIDTRKKMAQLLMMQASQPNKLALASNSPLLAAVAPIAQAMIARKKLAGVQSDQQALNASREADFQRIIQAGQGTPAQPAQPFKDEAGEFMGVGTPEGLVSQEARPAVPGSREAMVQAMMQAKDPQLRMAGLNLMAQGPQAKWEPLSGPRGSLLQRNSATGELKSVVGTTDPKMMELLAANLGGGQQPKDPVAPWGSIQDAKKRDEARIRFGVEADKDVQKANEEAANSQNVINDLDRFLFLNKNNSTGGQYRIPGAKAIGASFSSDIANMQSIIDRMTPLMRQGMPGSASNLDVAMFRGGTVGLERSPEANKNIALGLKIAHQNKIDKANFLSEYVTERGYSRNSDVEWRNYLNANPIFDHSAKAGSYALNQDRMGYREWVDAGRPKIGSQKASPQNNEIDSLLSKYTK